MDPLFIELQQALNEFLTYAELAFSKLSDDGKEGERNGRLEGRQRRWQEIFDHTKMRTDQLNAYLAQPNFMADEEALSRRLAFSRELTRWIGDSPPTWTAYYQDIDHALDKIFDIRREIDKKYQLGHYLDQKKVRAYQQARGADGA